MDEKEINAILEEENDINAVIDLDAITGPKGDDGLSAYEVAKENGFEGTEEEWLESLKQGPKGEDGVGIESVELTSTDGLIDTHTITYTDGSTSNFDVRNGEDGKDFTYDDFTIAQLEALKGQDGRGIVSIEKTGTEGLVDTYTITYTDGTTSTYTVSNGEDGEDGQGYIDTSDFVTFDHFDSTLENYATQEDIDNAVEQIDLSEYATTEYVDELINGIGESLDNINGEVIGGSSGESSGGSSSGTDNNETKTCTITFNANGGTGSMPVVTIEENSNYILPVNNFTPPTNGTFRSWLVDNEEKMVGTVIAVTKDLIITAMWDMPEHSEPDLGGDA